MKKTKRNLVSLLGVILTVLGVFGAIPGLLQKQYLIGVISVIFVIGGLICLAFAFGD